MANETDHHFHHVCPYPDCGGRRLSSNWCLAAHIRTVHEKLNPNNACNLCNKTLSRRSGLQMHIRSVHRGEKPFVCTHPGCHKAFACQKHVWGHAETHQQIAKPFPCTHCDKSFGNRTRHSLIHIGEKPFKCDRAECGKSFRSKQQLNYHTRTHTGDRPFKCTLCPFSSAAPCNLAEHVRTHTGEKPFTCDECGTAFAHKSNLNYTKPRYMYQLLLVVVTNVAFARRRTSAPITLFHQRTQHSVKSKVQLSCSICREVFQDRISLRKHKKPHLPERQFPCNLCGKAFRRKPDCLEHLRRHTREKPFSCSVTHGCGKSFLKAWQLRRHEEVHQIKKTCEGDSPNSRNVRRTTTMTPMTH